MAAYAQFGYGYPSANQLIGGVSQNAAGIPTVSAVGNASNSGGSVPSPLSGTNDASLSPSGDSTTTGVTTTGPQSPGAISQSSNNAGSGAPVPLAASPGAACALGSGGTGTVAGAAAPLAVDSNNSAADNRSGDTVSCCENGRPIMTDPVSGQTICSCQYDSARLTLSGYPGGGVGVGVYGGPYPSTEQNPYPSIGVDSSAFYSPLSNPYGMKDNNACSDMAGWQPTTGYYSYDPTLAAYGYGPSYDLASRRKNATRESTSTLKAWLNEHKKNPYPTKGEKIMLAIITKMTLTQVSTWFANARRRLKKENKMTWEPKNKTEDDDDAMLSDDEKEKGTGTGTGTGAGTGDGAQKSPGMYGESGLSDERHKDHNNQHVKSEHSKADKDDMSDGERQPENLVSMRGLSPYSSSYAAHGGYNAYHHHPPPPPHPHHHLQQQQQQHQQQQQQQQQQQHQTAVYYQPGYVGIQEAGNEYGIQKNPLSSDCGIPVPASKPKIWSLADTVACKTPPPTAYPGQNFYLQSQQPPPHQQQSVSQQQPHPAQPLSVHSHHHHQQPPPPPPSSLPPHHQAHPHQLLANSMMPQAVHSSPLSMMSSYAGGSPYSRIPTAYTEAMAMHVKAASTNVSDDISISIQQQYPSQPAQPHLQQQQQPRVGFSEIQPDTPPQTPPNMKLNVSSSNSSSSSNSGSLLAPQAAASLAALAAVPTASMCYTNSAAAHFNGIGIGIGIGLGSGNGFASAPMSSRSEA